MRQWLLGSMLISSRKQAKKWERKCEEEKEERQTKRPHY